MPGPFQSGLPGPEALVGFPDPGPRVGEGELLGRERDRRQEQGECIGKS